MKDAGVMYAVWFTQILRIWSCTIPKAKISISGAQYKAAEPSAAVYFCSINLHGLLTGMYTATQVQYMYVSVSPAALSGSSSSGKVSGCMHIYMHGRSWGVVIKFDEVIRSMFVFAGLF